MAGPHAVLNATDERKVNTEQTNPGPRGPAVILADPQMGENIGAAARAMANFGLTDLRIVRPRDGWPNPKAFAMAAGADSILAAARVFPDLAAATADLTLTLATTARLRTMVKPVLTPAEGMCRVAALAAQGAATGIVFGSERIGLVNDDIALCDAVVTIPTTAFDSLNLAQAVVVLGYEWFKANDATPAERIDAGATGPATKGELFGFFEHMETELDRTGFLHPPHKRDSMVRNLRNLWHRAQLTSQDVATLRGIVVALTGRPFRKDPP